MIHIIRKGDGSIKTAGEGDGSDWILETGETLEVIADQTLANYAGRLRLSSDKSAIVADGIDEVTVTVTTNIQPAPEQISLQVNEASVVVSLTGGSGTFAVVAEVAGIILIEPTDKALYMAAGEGILGIEAV